MSDPGRSGRDDRGVSALIFAMLLTVLLTMSAFAVDIGAAYTERRHDQNTVDAAVMSAAVEAVIGEGELQFVVEEVKDKVDITLGRTLTKEEWLSCKDPDALDYDTITLAAANNVISPPSQCISFNITFDRIRVKLPEQESQAVFGPALGFSPIRTTASAVAEVVNGAGSGAPPFVALSTATQGDFDCLRTSSASTKQPQNLLKGNGPGVAPSVSNRADPCNATAYPTSSQNFGTIQPYRYSKGCTQQNADVEVAVSIGIDHIMGFFKDGFTGVTGIINPGDKVDGDDGCLQAFPDTFEVDTGFNAQGLRCALISLKNTTTCNGEVPRFQQGPFVQAVDQFAGEDMDNSAIWNFLRPAADMYNNPDIPMSCVVLAASRPSDTFNSAAGSVGTWNSDPVVKAFPFPTAYSQVTDASGFVVGFTPSTYTTLDLRANASSPIPDSAWDYYDRFDLLTECLESWSPADLGVEDELFELPIGESPRFAFIPKVAESNLTNVDYVHIESFIPTYMLRLYQEAPSGVKNCDPTDPRASVVFKTHDAGQLFDCGDANANVDRLSSVMLACGMVPTALCNKNTGAPDFAGQDIYEFRLAE